MTGLEHQRYGKRTPWQGLAVTVLAGFLTMAAALSAPVYAQDLQTLIDRLERLERDVRTLNIQLARGDSVASTVAAGEAAETAISAGPSGVAHLDTRITALENDLRSVTGSVEELGYQINQLTTRIDKLIGDVDYRLSELERGRVASTGQAPPQGNGLIAQDGSSSSQPVTPQVSKGTGILGTITEQELATAGSTVPAGDSAAEQGETATSTGSGLSSEELSAPAPATTDSSSSANNAETEVAALTPQDAYAQAFALLRQAKYDEAAVALQTFVDEYGEHELASNARYWLGETYYVRSEYVRAAEVFFEAYRLAPQGPKAPDTLLKLGMALGNLGKQPEACAAFAKLTQEFPNPSPAIISKLDRERTRNGCEAN